MFQSLAYLAVVPGVPAAFFIGWCWLHLHRRDQRFRRPFEEMPRPAGWSLQCRMDDLMMKFSMLYFSAITTGAALSMSSKTNLELAPINLAIGIIFCSILFLLSARYILRYSNYHFGIIGEQLVGHMLDRLSSDSIHVFHDLVVREPGKKDWNIDHVVLTPAGVFAIETKCRRKPRKIVPPGGQQCHKIIYDGKQLIFPHTGSTRCGLDQAEKNAAWLGKKLSSHLGAPIPVAPVLVFPGWWIEAKSKDPVAVLNPKGIQSYLRRRKPVLTGPQQRAIRAQLEEHCRIDLSRPD